MKTINYWDKFLQSGCVEDYLSFKAANIDRNGQKETGNCNNSTGDSPYAGFSNHNGNCNESSAYRGV